MISLVLTVVVCLCVAVQAVRRQPRSSASATGMPIAVGGSAARSTGQPRWLLTVLKAGGVVIAAGAFLLLAGQAANAEETVDDQVAAAGQQLVRDLSGEDASGTGTDTTGSGEPEPEATDSDAGVASASDGAGSGADAADDQVAPDLDPVVDPVVVGSAAEVDPAVADPAAVVAEVDPAPVAPDVEPATQADPLADPAGDAARTQADGSATPGDESATGAESDSADSPTTDSAVTNSAPTGNDTTNAATTGSDTTDTDTTGSATTGSEGSGSGSGSWSLDLFGAGTLSSDGQNLTWRADEGAAPTLSQLVDQILSIVVTGKAATNTLTVTGPLGRLLTFLGAGNDRLVFGAGDNTIRVTGDRQGTVGDSTEAPTVTFAGVGEVGSAGPDTYVVDGPASLNTLTLDGADQLVIGGGGASPAGSLTVATATLAGTLLVTGAQDGTFLSFGAVTGDFDTFRGLDLGAGAYLRPVLDDGGYRLVTTQLPGGITVGFPTTAAADDFFAAISGKRNQFVAGTRVVVDLQGQRLTGSLTLSGTPGGATMDLAGAQLTFGDPDAPLATLTATDAARFTLTQAAFAGQFAGRLATTIPGVAFDGLFTSRIDTATGTITATGTDVTLVIAGQRIAVGSLVVTAVHGPSGWALRVTAPSGAVVTFGPQSLVTATLLSDLALLFEAGGAATSIPVAVSLSGVAGTTLSGAFDLRIDTASGLSLAGFGATMTSGAAAVTGDLVLRPVLTGTGDQAVAVTFGVVDVVLFGGLLTLLGLAGGTFLVSRSGVAGSVSGAGTITLDGVAGTVAAATVKLNSTGTTGPLRYLVNTVVTTIASRGPPLSVELSGVQTTVHSSIGAIALTGDVTISSTAVSMSDGTGTVVRASDFTLTRTNSGFRFAWAPATWQVELDNHTDHLITIGTDGSDLVLTVDGVSTRRAVQGVSSLTITAVGAAATTLRLLGTMPVPVAFAGGTGIDNIAGPAADTVLAGHRRGRRQRRRADLHRGRAPRRRGGQPGRLRVHARRLPGPRRRGRTARLRHHALRRATRNGGRHRGVPAQRHRLRHRGVRRGEPPLRRARAGDQHHDGRRHRGHLHRPHRCAHGLDERRQPGHRRDEGREVRISDADRIGDDQRRRRQGHLRHGQCRDRNAHGQQRRPDHRRRQPDGEERSPCTRCAISPSTTVSRSSRPPATSPWASSPRPMPPGRPARSRSSGTWSQTDR